MWIILKNRGKLNFLKVFNAMVIELWKISRIFGVYLKNEKIH